MKKSSKSNTFTASQVGTLIEELRSDFKVFGEGLVVLTSKVDVLDGKVDVLDSRVSSLELRMTGVEIRLTSVETRLTRVEIVLKPLHTMLSNHESRIVSLETVKK